MAVEHSTLTGSSLHEPKGVAAAAANRVYVSDGAGSGSWATVGNSVLATEAKAFQSGLLHIQDQKAPGTEGGTFTAAAWQTRDLNTVVTNEISGASLGSNQITLPVGTYWIEASAPGNQVNGHKIGIRNVTDATEAVIEGTSAYSASGLDTNNRSFLSGRLTIGGTKIISLRHISESTKSTNGFGEDTNTSASEIYADIKIWKIA